MNIAGLKVRIKFQQNVTEIDEIGNHTNVWQDYYTCWAKVVASGKSADETIEAAQTLEQSRLDFTVRYCSEIAAITSIGYRIIFDGRTYDILNVDIVPGESRKFQTRLVRRS